MARLPYVDRESLPVGFRTLSLSRSNITRALSNSPDVVARSNSAAQFIREGMGVDPRLRELAIIQVGYSTRCAYEYAHHIATGLACGVSEADIKAIADETAGRKSGLEPLACLVLRASREITDAVALSDQTFGALQASLGNELLVQLLFAIANYNAVVRLLNALDVDLEPEYFEYLERFPLPSRVEPAR
ncbi:MAG: carboxymuconolactone decarboxylase family protein [Hyphomicrobiales bacterium]